MAASFQNYDDIIALGEAQLRSISPTASERRARELAAFQSFNRTDTKYIYDQIRLMEKSLGDPVSRLSDEEVRSLGVCCIIASLFVCAGVIASFTGHAKTWGVLVPVGLTLLWLFGEVANRMAKAR